jgi:hypothetical protein
MIRSPHPPPLEARVEARRPISADLLAAVSGEPLTLAERFAEAWFDTAVVLVAFGRVIVFDDMVIGPPCPMLLETAHHVRSTRRAERTGAFDEEEERWYADHRDDDEFYEPPTIQQRVLDSMASQQEHHRLVTDGVVALGVWRAFDTDHDVLMPVVHLLGAMGRLLVELAGAVRIGQGVVVDARLPGERADGLRWAA